jgi:hypothetical protein
MRPIFTQQEINNIERALIDSDRPDVLRAWRRGFDRAAAPEAQAISAQLEAPAHALPPAAKKPGRK